MPLWTDIVIAVAAAFTVAILLAAAFLVWHEVRCIERAREAQLLTDLSRRWNEEELTKSRKAARNYKNGVELQKALQKLRENNEQEYYDLVRLPDFFEALGVLVNSGCLSKQLTKDLFGTVIKHFYHLYGPAIQYLREIYDDKNIYALFDDLAQKLNIISTEEKTSR